MRNKKLRNIVEFGMKLKRARRKVPFLGEINLHLFIYGTV